MIVKLLLTALIILSPNFHVFAMTEDANTSMAEMSQLAHSPKSDSCMVSCLKESHNQVAIVSNNAISQLLPFLPVSMIPVELLRFDGSNNQITRPSGESPPDLVILYSYYLS